MEEKIADRIKTLLREREFLYVATVDAQCQPNAAPKFFLKLEGTRLYLVDCVMGQTWRNFKTNNSVSIPLMDTATLLGYRINGKAFIVEDGPQREGLTKELADKQIRLSAERVIENIRQEKGKRNLEVQFPDNVGIFYIEVESVVEIGPTGSLVWRK